MDVLDDILDTLDLRGALYFRTDFRPPWSVAVPELHQAARFHLVVQGNCHVCFQSGETVEIGPGDLILIPRGQSHVIADNPSRVAAPLETVMADSGYAGNGVFVFGEGNPDASTQLVCGHYTFRHSADHPLLKALPDHLEIRASTRAEEPWLDDMLRLIPRRLFAGEMGSEAAVTRLSEIVFIELIRVGVRQTPELKAVMHAFEDRFVGKALNLIHTRPEHSWTVESLAREIGMSRSRFSDRFRLMMDASPISYLSEWRLQKALALLDETRQSVQQVAFKTGYRSAAAFTRAFAGKFGLSPSQYRRDTA